VEAIEDAIQVLGRNPTPGIYDCHLGHHVAPSECERDAALGCIPYCVRREIQKDLSDTSRVTQHLNGAVQLGTHRYVPPCGHVYGDLLYFAHYIHHVECLSIHGQLLILASSDQQQAFDDAAHPVYLVTGGRQCLSDLLTVSVLSKRPLNLGAQVGERRPEFMACISRERLECTMRSLYSIDHAVDLIS
jgi:hypothetical protein